MPEADEELMQKLQRDGDEAAFTQIVERHQRGLLNFFYQFCWDRPLAEDLSQEVFCRLFAHRESYSVTAKFTTYLYRIARNLWIDYVRAHKNRPTVVSLETETESGMLKDHVILKPRVPHHEPTVDEAIQQSELAERVQKALDQLPAEQREVFVLAKTQGMKYAEVADVLDIPVGTVRSRMHAATRRLQSLLSHPDHRTKEP